MPRTRTVSASEAIDITALHAQLGHESTEKIRLRFFECYAGAANLIAEAAVCVKILDDREEDLTGLPMVGTFRRIASGQVLPALVWQFIESPNRQLVEGLPLKHQERLVRDPVVEVVERKPEGGFTKVMVDLTRAPREIGRLIAGPDGIRTLREQMAHLGVQRVRPSAAKPAPADEEAEPGPAGPLSHKLTVRLTATELERLRVNAARARVDDAEYVRRAIRRGGGFMA
jgi:hypothetical protein